MTDHRRFREDRLVIASHNDGKVREINDLLSPLGVAVYSAAALNLPEPEETGETFIENALIKAGSSTRFSSIPALADDSGLAVDVLGGAPGIHSARWAGPERDFGGAMNKIMEATADFETVKAHFVCALALCWPDGHTETFEGTVHGSLVWPPRGDRGFGYDPIFVPDRDDSDDTRTFAEMEPEEKHAISHRADAFRQLVAACFSD